MQCVLAVPAGVVVVVVGVFALALGALLLNNFGLVAYF